MRAGEKSYASVCFQIQQQTPNDSGDVDTAWGNQLLPSADLLRGGDLWLGQMLPVVFWYGGGLALSTHFQRGVIITRLGTDLFGWRFKMS